MLFSSQRGCDSPNIKSSWSGGREQKWGSSLGSFGLELEVWWGGLKGGTVKSSLYREEACGWEWACVLTSWAEEWPGGTAFGEGSPREVKCLSCARNLYIWRTFAECSSGVNSKWKFTLYPSRFLGNWQIGKWKNHLPYSQGHQS